MGSVYRCMVFNNFDAELNAMKRLFEVVVLKDGKTTPMEPRTFFEAKEGRGGAKEFRDGRKRKDLLIIRGPDHQRFHGGKK